MGHRLIDSRRHTKANVMKNDISILRINYGEANERVPGFQSLQPEPPTTNGMMSRKKKYSVSALIQLRTAWNHFLHNLFISHNNSNTFQSRVLPLSLSVSRSLIRSTRYIHYFLLFGLFVFLTFTGNVASKCHSGPVTERREIEFLIKRNERCTQWHAHTDARTAYIWDENAIPEKLTGRVDVQICVRINWKFSRNWKHRTESFDEFTFRVEIERGRERVHLVTERVRGKHERKMWQHVACYQYTHAHAARLKLR